VVAGAGLKSDYHQLSFAVFSRGRTGGAAYNPRRTAKITVNLQ